MNKLLFTLAIFLILSSAGYAQRNDTLTISDDLQIVPISEKAILHVSYMNTNSFGRVACNGLLYIDGKEALMMDTPATNEITRQLMDWMAKTHPGVVLKGIVVNHFHEDALGGLDALHAAGVPSYSSALTAQLAGKAGYTVPQHTFDKRKAIKVGNTKVMCHYLGEGHTRDNIVAWIPGENIIFGGCLVKTMNAGKGNVADANVEEWPATIRRVKSTYAQAKVVIPGHGPHGGTELLDYTIQLFSRPE